MSPASLPEIAARYAELEALLVRAIAACQAKDAGQAVLLACAITQKLTTLDERVLALGIGPYGLVLPG